MIIDSHCHLDLKDFNPDRDEVINRAESCDVEIIINPGIDLESSRRAIELSQKYSGVYAAVGIQPEEVNQYFETEPDPKFLNPAKIKIDVRTELTRLAQNGKVVAIGECGLDYKYISSKFGVQSSEKSGIEKEKQKDVFRRQLGTAVLLDLPVIIHNREADEDILAEIQRYTETKKLRGVFHCFTGTEPFARKILEHDFLISFTGLITYPKNDELRKVIKELPLEKIMVETDAPFLAPQNHRGDRNEPAFVTEVVKTIAEIKSLPPDEVSRITSQNTRRAFKI